MTRFTDALLDLAIPLLPQQVKPRLRSERTNRAAIGRTTFGGV